MDVKMMGVLKSIWNGCEYDGRVALWRAADILLKVDEQTRKFALQDYVEWGGRHGQAFNQTPPERLERLKREKAMMEDEIQHLEERIANPPAPIFVPNGESFVKPLLDALKLKTEMEDEAERRKTHPWEFDSDTQPWQEGSD